MFEKFLEYNRNQNLFNSADKVLLAVSGGVDSVVMTDLFAKNNANFAIAHCNFNLRGKESDEDMEFVKNLAEKLNVDFHHIRFKTGEEAERRGISIQMAARDLRYAWFQDIAEAHNFTAIALAHNRNDQVETFFMNLVRGTGIQGMTGIKPVNGNLIRPLLFADRDDIEKYARNHHISFREDSSNSESKYLRNKLRLNIIPLLREINPSLNQTIETEIEILKRVSAQYFEGIQQLRKKYLKNNDDEWRISRNILKKELNDPYLLFDILSEFGFRRETLQDMIHAINEEPGKLFHSSRFTALIDRDDVIIQARNTDGFTKAFFINEETRFLKIPMHMQFEKTEWKQGLQWPVSKNCVSVDFEKLKFPLTLRQWKNGDYFYPLGLKGRKKISDYFTDQKINWFEKQNTWVLTSDDQIVWIIGQRLDDRFKISDSTKYQYRIELKALKNEDYGE